MGNQLCVSKGTSLELVEEGARNRQSSGYLGSLCSFRRTPRPVVEDETESESEDEDIEPDEEETEAYAEALRILREYDSGNLDLVLARGKAGQPSDSSLDSATSRKIRGSRTENNSGSALKTVIGGGAVAAYLIAAGYRFARHM